MVYYILLSTEPKENVMYDSCILGETSMKSFYANRGLSKLTKIVNEHTELIDSVKIFDDNNKQYTIEQFLNILTNYKIQQQ